MVSSIEEEDSKKCSFETALELTGFGKYNMGMLVACCLLIMAMNVEIFGIGVVLPAIACDMRLSTTQQGMLSAVPLIGVIISSYCWGLAADIIGRRKTLLIAMPIGFILALATSMAPTFITMTVLKFFSSMFLPAAYAAASVLFAESVPSRYRSRYIIVLVSANFIPLLFVCSCTLPFLKLTFHWEITWLNVVYRPWRLVLQIISLPGLVGTLVLLFLKESPKYLLSKKRDEEALVVLQTIFQINTGYKKTAYSVEHVNFDEPMTTVSNATETSALRKIWDRTAPLFKPPLLKNSIIFYYLILSAFMTVTGYTMWVPTIVNAIFTGEDNSGLTFCQMASRIAQSHSTNSTVSEDCNDIIHPMTLYAVMVYSGLSVLIIILLSVIVEPLGLKATTLLVYCISTLCGLLLFFVRVPLLSMFLLFIYLYVALILGNINTYLVELNPTHLRGMASCLSVVVGRGFGFVSIQLISKLMKNYCTPMLAGYVALVASGLIVAIFLPPDSKKKVVDKDNNNREIVDGPNNNKIN